jgi:hypothetical protein
MSLKHAQLAYKSSQMWQKIAQSSYPGFILLFPSPESSLLFQLLSLGFKSGLLLLIWTFKLSLGVNYFGSTTVLATFFKELVNFFPSHLVTLNEDFLKASSGSTVVRALALGSKDWGIESKWENNST